MLRFVHAKRVLFPLVASVTTILASSAGCDWVDKVDRAAVTGPGEDSGPGAPTARFNVAVGASSAPEFLQVPFPSDVYLTNGRVVAPPGLDKVVLKGGADFLAHDMAVNNGFSRIALSLFYVDDPATKRDDEIGAASIDVSSLPADETACAADGSSVFLIDLQETDPAKARIPCRAMFRTDKNGTRPVVAVGPARGVVLKEGRSYAAVLTNRIKTASGAKIAASADFDRIRKGERAGSIASLYGEKYDKVKTALGSALATDEIVALAPFTTQSMSDELFKLREAIDDTPVPELKWGAADLAPMGKAKFGDSAGVTLPEPFTATLDAYFGTATFKTPVDPKTDDDPSTHRAVRAHNRIGAIGTAVFNAASFLQDKSGYRTLDHATFARKSNGELDLTVPSATKKIWVTFAVPKDPPAVASGYPVVILQHGLGGSRDYIFALANVFAAKGFATVAIDSVTFGARTADPSLQVDTNTDYELAKDKTQATYAGPDGLADAVKGTRQGATDLFGSLINIGALRDQMRQAALDTVQLVRVLRDDRNIGSLSEHLNLTTDAAKAPKIDKERIAFVGNSLGGIQGALAAAIEPNVKQWVLNVAGGGIITELGTHSPRISESLKQAGAINFGFISDKITEGHPLATLLQTVADPGDPLCYAEALIKQPRSVKSVKVAPRNILQVEVLYDELVPNESNEALARAGGWGIGTPNAGSNAGVLDLKDLTKRSGVVPLPNVDPVDATGFPFKVFANNVTSNDGVSATAVLLQMSPSQHGSDMDSAGTKRVYQAPYARFDAAEPFPKVAAGDTGYIFATPNMYQLQAIVTTFLQTGFAPGGTARIPALPGFKPVRDVDADGALDDVDPDPNDPTKK